MALQYSIQSPAIAVISADGVPQTPIILSVNSVVEVRSSVEGCTLIEAKLGPHTIIVRSSDLRDRATLIQ